MTSQNGATRAATAGNGNNGSTAVLERRRTGKKNRHKHDRLEHPRDHHAPPKGRERFAAAPNNNADNGKGATTTASIAAVKTTTEAGNDVKSQAKMEPGKVRFSTYVIFLMPNGQQTQPRQVTKQSQKAIGQIPNGAIGYMFYDMAAVVVERNRQLVMLSNNQACNVSPEFYFDAAIGNAWDLQKQGIITERLRDQIVQSGDGRIDLIVMKPYGAKNDPIDSVKCVMENMGRFKVLNNLAANAPAKTTTGDTTDVS